MSPTPLSAWYYGKGEGEGVSDPGEGRLDWNRDADGRLVLEVVYDNGYRWRWEPDGPIFELEGEDAWQRMAVEAADPEDRAQAVAMLRIIWEANRRAEEQWS